MKKKLQNWKRWLLPAVYAAAVGLWLLWGLFCLVFDAACGEAPLSPAAAEPVNAEALSPGVFRTGSIDGQLVFENVDAAVRTVRLSAEFESWPGEMELFYTRRAGAGFSPRQRALGAPQNDGSVLYTLPPGHVQALRVDLGGVNGNTVAVEGIALNPAQPAARYFVPSLRALLGLAAWPALACCAICTIIEGITGARAFVRGRQKKAGATGGE